MDHLELQVPLQIHKQFQARVEALAARKLAEEDEDMPAKALEVAAVFMCATCDSPFYGGRVQCADQQDLSSEELICTEFEWAATSGYVDYRCIAHGHDFAIYKCDFCCDVAVYRCSGSTNFCERCHERPFENIFHVCKGLECSLCVSHPPITSETGEGAVRSFVLGCTACHGADANESFLVTAGEKGEFGYPQRQWAEFTGGDVLLAALGPKEVAIRMAQCHADAVQDGSVAERAERLLLLELNICSAEDVMDSIGSDCLAVLQRRLKALGWAAHGDARQCAISLLHCRAGTVSNVTPFNSEFDDELPPLEDAE